MRERRWLLLTLYGLLIAIAVSDALKATRPKFKIATSSTTTTTEEPAAAESADDEVEATTTASTDANATTGHTLTGIPQIDYIWDPNLPRELNGYNLSEYPFYASMPEDIDFKCDGLHDGFYASVPHKCQVYHHCLYGTRYDFLCANFTAFDQKTFICHFVSEVDCANSKKYWHRNDALYKAADSTTTSTSTTTTSTTTTTPSSVDKGDRGSNRDRDLPPRRRRPLVRRPVYDYYDDEYYDDDYDRTRPRGYNRRDYDDYEDRKYRRDRDRDVEYRHRDFRGRDRDRLPMRGNRRDPARARDPIDDEPVRPRVRDQDPSRTRDVEDRVRDGEDRRYADKRFKDDYDEKDSGSVSSAGSGEGLAKPVAPPSSVYARPRVPPKFRRPVPLHEKDKYTTTTVRAPIEESRRRPAADDMDEPRRRPAMDDLEEPRRRPAAAVEDLEEPRSRRPVADSVDEPRRRPVAAVDDLEEPRSRRPMSDGLDEPRRRPAAAVDELEEQRSRRPMSDSMEEPRRRPMIDSLEDRRRPVAADALDEDYYYDDEMEEVRPRWMMRGRPLRDRDLSDKRYRDRPFRSRYRDEEEDVRPRKHPERSRDRFYERERGRDRSLDRGKERNMDRDRLRGQEPDKSDRPSVYSRERESERPRTPPPRPKDLPEITEAPKKPASIYDRTTTSSSTTTPSTSTTTSTTSTTTTEAPERETANPQTEDRPQKYSHATLQPKPQYQESNAEKDSKYWKPTQAPESSRGGEEEPIDDYPSEYYDDVEEPAIVPVPPPRPTVRVIKRPFLPSRGGNPNPRGLSSVGSKAISSARENPIKHYIKLHTTTASYEDEARQETYQIKERPNYKSVQQAQPVLKQQQQQQQQHQQVADNYDLPVSRPGLHRPEPEVPKRRPEIQEVPVLQKSSPNRSPDYGIQEQQNNDANNRHQQNDNSNLYSSSYKTDDVQEQLAMNGNFKVRQKINEVVHHNLQDIPESEYDVTLNEALAPNLSPEPNIPSGFVLPLHRQLGRDAILQPSENTYKFSRPLNAQQHQQQKQQQRQQAQQQAQQHAQQVQQQAQQAQQAQLAQQQQQQHSAFVPSTQFGQQTTDVARSNDRGKTVYFRTPETIQISGTQYRQQRGHWGDYTRF